MSKRFRSPRRASVARAAAGGMLVTLLGIALPAHALQQLVVVRKSGQATSYASQTKIGPAANAACADDTVAFAFVAESRDGATLELQRGIDTSHEIVIDVTVTCSTLSGTALIPFDAQGGSAIRGRDYLSTPGIALLDLSAASTQPGSTAPVAAGVHIEVLDNAQAGSATRTFSIMRREGSFQGSWPGGAPTVGAVPGSNDPLVAVSIIAETSIADAAGRIPGIDPAAEQVRNAATAYCGAGGGGAASAGCAATRRAARALGDGSGSIDQRNAAIAVLENNLLAIAPDETTALAFVAPRSASAQRDNIAQRLATLRSGERDGGVSTDGLMLVNGGLPLSLGGLPALLRVDDEASADNEEQRTLLGGSRLGLWINGTLGGGERDRRAANSGFDSDTWEVTSGLDYRFSDQFFAGAALGYSRFNGDFERDQGSLDADSRSLHVYAGYSLPNGLGFDGSLSALRSNYTQRRVIELYELDDAGTGYHSLGRDIATGDTRVNQRGASVGMTWTFIREAWTIAPQAQLSALRTDYAAFEESGSSDFNLGYRDRHGRSRSMSIGTYVDRTWATAIGAFRPYGRAFYFRDSGASKDLLAEFVAANDDGSHTPISLRMNEPDRRYGTGELGLGFSRPIGTRTVDFTMGYLQMFSFADWDRWALRFDMRIPL